MKFEIRRKEFPYTDAPELDGVSAGYEALAVDGAGSVILVSRHAKALDAAIAAAAAAHGMNHSGNTGTRAAVRGFWTGQRPPGVMKQMMPVLYRARV